MEVPEPWNWKQLQDYKRDPYKFTEIPRSMEVKAHHQKVKHIPNSERNKNLLKLLRFNDENRLFALTDNKYPYHIEPGIRHMVLFINPRYSLINRPEIIEYLVSSNAWKMGYSEYLYFENPPERKSIPEIEHYQVFMRKNPNQIGIIRSSLL